MCRLSFICHEVIRFEYIIYIYIQFFFPEFSLSEFGLYLGVFGAIMALLFALTIGTFTAVIIRLCKTKSKLELKLHQNTENECKIYEEIDNRQHAAVETANNVAYATCHKIVQSASCTNTSIKI